MSHEGGAEDDYPWAFGEMTQTTQCPPRVIVRGADLRQTVVDAQRSGATVGLVPTMGALHEGHLSLVDAARAECDLVVVTIFVNPTQFAAGEDYERYPADLDADLAQLSGRGCDVAFAPSVDEMYRPGHQTSIDVGSVAVPLEGTHRPTHFRGVATVVLKLFQLAPADRAYFGRKDYQQALVIQKMVDDLRVPMEVCICPIVRESDGLAMSSRNAYLSDDQRRRAVALHECLQLARQLAASGERSVEVIRDQMQQHIASVGGIDIEYIAMVEEGTVTPVDAITGPTAVLIAARVGSARLIDNCLIE
jgi:pantoate--beta-alanine ligase